MEKKLQKKDGVSKEQKNHLTQYIVFLLQKKRSFMSVLTSNLFDINECFKRKKFKMSDFEDDDEDVIIPPYLFRLIDDEDKTESYREFVENMPRFCSISTVSSRNLAFDSINTDWFSSNNEADRILSNTLNVASVNSTSTTHTLESLIDLTPVVEDGAISSQFIEMRNNIINNHLNEGNISLYRNGVIEEESSTGRNSLRNYADSCIDVGGVVVQWNRLGRSSRVPVSSASQPQSQNSVSGTGTTSSAPTPCSESGPSSAPPAWPRQVNALRHANRLGSIRTRGGYRPAIGLRIGRTAVSPLASQENVLLRSSTNRSSRYYHLDVTTNLSRIEEPPINRLDHRRWYDLDIDNLRSYRSTNNDAAGDFESNIFDDLSLETNAAEHNDESEDV